MKDKHEIVAFSCEGEKILGVVIEHYTNPLEDSYLVYADYTLHRFTDPDEDALTIINNVIIPACDEALAEFRLKRQHIKDMNKYNKDIGALMAEIANNMKNPLDE